MRKRFYTVLVSGVLLLALGVVFASDTQSMIMLLTDAKKLDAALAKSPSAVKEKSEDGMTLLHMAAMMNLKDAVSVLVKHKADVNAKSGDGATPLHMAVIIGDQDVVELLVSKGANIKAQMNDDPNSTPLAMAQLYGKPEIVKALSGKSGEEPGVPRTNPGPPGGSPSSSRSSDPAPEPKAIPFERKPGAPGTRAVIHEQKTVNGCPVNVIKADLKDSRVRVNASVASNGIGSDESFGSFIGRTKPVAAINGAFFSKGDLKPIGDIVIDGQLVHFGGMGTGICITEDCRVEFIQAVRARHTDWSNYKTVICCGPKLLADGRVVVDPQGEGFRDPHVLGKANRTAVGLAPGNKLLLVNTKKGVSLREWAGIMKSLGCTEAVNFDGGASMAMYYRGKTISTPGRKLTNVLLVYE